MVALSKNVNHTTVGWQRKVFKLQYVKRPKTAKKNLEQKINNSKPHIWSLSFDFRLSSKNSQNQQKLAKKITHFIAKFRSKNRTHFTNLNSLKIIKNILQQHSQKPYSLYKFSCKNASGWSQKKIFPLCNF